MIDEGPSLRVRVARASFVAVLVVAPLVVGSVHPLVVGAEAALLCLAAFLGAGAPEAGAARSFGRVGLLFVGAVLWTAFQLVPLPALVLRLLSPRAHAVWIGGPLIRGASWAALTLDRSATAGALAFGIALCAAWVCPRILWLPRDVNGPRGPLRMVAIAAVAAAVMAVAHAVVGAERVFGLYRPISQHASLVSLPVVNPNHLAALTNLGALACLGLALDEDRRELRFLWIGAATFCAVVTLLTLSRGGVVALGLGATFFFVRARSSRSLRLTAAIGLAGVVASAGAYLAQDRLGTELSTLFHVGGGNDGSKFAVFRDAGRMAIGFPLTGAGRGCFRFGFPPFDRQGGHFAFSHPECLPLQLATEWGIPFALAFLAVCSAAWLQAARRPAGSAARSAALAAVGAVVLQNLVDFSLEIAAVALPTVVCLAMVVTPSSRRRAARRPREASRYAPVWIAAGAVALGAGFVAARWGYDAAGDRISRMASGHARARVLAAVGLEAMRAHPADAYLPIQVARGLVHSRPRSALRFLNRALWLDPHSPAAHLLTGRALLRLGHLGQAVLHYRAAARWDPVESRMVAREVAARVRDGEVALRLVPSGEGGIVVLRSLAEAYQERGDHETAVWLAHALVRRSHRGSREYAFLARVLVGAGHSTEAIAAARETYGKDGECDGALWASVALEQLGRKSEQAPLLQRAARLCPDDARLRERLVLVAIEGRDFPTAEDALAMYRGIVGSGGEPLARGHFLEGRLEAAQQHDARAAAAFQRAAELAPQNAAYLESARGAWERIGRPDRAEPLRRALAGLRQ